ncbi:MAG TPA: trypsin [Cyanobacteria bacterium UBA8803]|nr:trypsin [Cyanobacteria bacterium UBA9273]HBL58750.1 trypsin [Cyanobacteria bacterium UBA8803]
MTTLQSKTPHLGGLYAQSTTEQPLVFPLKHTEVQAKITGNMSRVEVTQTFENAFTTPLEAVYVFPLPDEAAVDDMEIKIGDRIIKGNIKKREEAVALYQQAKQQGRTAGLLEQERDNIFTQSLANIKPGEQIDVTIRYTDSLKFAGGDYEFVFPMVVGPRFIPGRLIDENGDTDEVPDASRITPPIMPEGMRPGHDIGITVEIDAGVPILKVNSPSHQLRLGYAGQTVRVQLGGEDTIPNKDLIVRYQVAGNNTQATVLTQADERGGHFAIYFIPALAYSADEIVAKDVVFLMDTSGSQHGDPLCKCQELMRRFINGLNPNDTFTIIDFSDTTQQLSAAPLANTPQNRQKAIAYINRLQANGGTDLLNGIRAVMNFPAPPAGRLRSIVLLTDGYIGNENQILAEVQQALKPGNRLYSFGVGSSVNRFLLNRIAEIGRGTSRIIRQDEPTEEVAEKFFRQINNPVLTNIQICWEGAGENPLIYPATAPDLFAEQPLVLFGKKSDRTAGKLHVTGIAASGYYYQQTFTLNFEEIGNLAIAQLWGRARIKELMNQMFSVETKAGVEAVTDTALTYQLLSQYTAFVAVSDDVQVEPGSASISMNVPVDMPEGVSYQGICGAPTAFFAPTLYKTMVEPANLAAPPPPAPRSSRVLFKRALSAPNPTPASAPMPAPMEAYELSAIDPSCVDCFLERELAAPAHHQLEVVQVTGLAQGEIAALTQHLQQLTLPAGFSGIIVFEFTISKGRVRKILLDEEASSLKKTKVIELIKQSLHTWHPPQPVTGTMVLTLRIQ